MRARLLETSAGPRTRLGESPRWDGTAWWWVDASAGEVWTRRPGGHAVMAWQTGRRTSLVHPASDGRVVVVRESQLWILTPEAGGEWGRQLWCELDLHDGWLLNDGVADHHGRLWIGSIAPDRAPLGGALLRVERDGSVHTATDGFTLSNGMAWDPIAGALLHVDTGERTIWRHRVDPETGSVGTREPFVDLTAGDGMPDGLTTDAAGGVWAAIYGSGQVRRYTPAGRIDAVVDVDTAQCTSVELGGPDGKDLLITTAREGFDDARSAIEPLAGRLYCARSRYSAAPKPVVKPLITWSSH